MPTRDSEIMEKTKLIAEWSSFLLTFLDDPDPDLPGCRCPKYLHMDKSVSAFHG